MFRPAQAEIGRRKKFGSPVGHAMRGAMLGLGLCAVGLLVNISGCAPGAHGEVSFMGITYSYRALTKQEDQALFLNSVGRLSPRLNVYTTDRPGQGDVRFDLKTYTYPKSGEVYYNNGD